MVPVDKLQLIQQRFKYLEAKMNDGVSGDEIAKLGREYSDLKPVIDSIEEYFQTLEEVQDASDMLEDPDMRGLAEEELPRLKARLPKLESELQLALLPKDAADARPAIIEIRPGTGGEEAALFAGDLLRMYQRYCDTRGWNFEIIEEQQTELGGIKEVVAHVRAKLYLLGSNMKVACTGCNACQKRKAAGAFTPRLPPLRCFPRPKMLIFKFLRMIFALIRCAVQGQGGSMSTPPILPFGSRICRQGWWLPVLKNRSIAIGKSPCRC